MRKVSRLVAFVLLIPSARRKTQWNLYLTRRNEICTPLNRPDFSPNLSGKRGKAFRFTNAWEQRKLGDVLEFLKDGTHGTHPDADQGSLLLSAKNIKNGDVTWDDTDRKISQAEFDMIHSNFKLKKGDVLLTIVGSIGESAILKDPHEITFQRSVAFLRPNKTITSGFLYSEIQGEKFQTELNNRKSTSAQPGIYLGDLSEIPLDTPPNLKEQEEIGKFFSEINSLLTLHQRQSENAESRSAFGDRQGHSGALCRGRSDRRCAWRRSSRLERCD